MSERYLTPIRSMDDEEERQNFLKIIEALKNYRAASEDRVQKAETYLRSLPEDHQDLLSKYREHLNKIRICIDTNYSVILQMLKHCDELFDNDRTNSTNGENFTCNQKSDENAAVVDPFKILKVQVILKQFARDWSAVGEVERNQCYKPIIDAVVRYYQPDSMDIKNIKILVPGAGLGRLSYELASIGYCCEGNEFSLFMLIASNFVLNKCQNKDQYVIHPWVHQYTNNVNRKDQIAPITFPDVSPLENPPKGTFNMVAGDFLEVYTEPEAWDCVATCFFIDCANNVVAFLETIYRILKPGAIWVNIGPLLYHYSDVENEFSIEPTYEDLLSIIEQIGFEILENETNVRTKYTSNPRSMLQYEYLSAFSVCKKPLNTKD